MKKKISEANTEKIFREFYGAGTFIEKSAIPSEYGFKSKNQESSPFLCVNSSFSYIKYVYAAFIFSNVL